MGDIGSNVDGRRLCLLKELTQLLGEDERYWVLAMKLMSMGGIIDVSTSSLDIRPFGTNNPISWYRRTGHK